MGKTKTKLLTLLITPIFLGACATQDASQGVSTVDSESTKQCFRECEYVHGGTVRGCTVGRSGRTRSASFIEDCVNSAYGQLRICYQSCD